MKRDEKGKPAKSSDFVGSANLHKYFRTDHSAQHVDSPSFQGWIAIILRTQQFIKTYSESTHRMRLTTFD